jgi:SOS-response transcriptional repressor LexA
MKNVRPIDRALAEAEKRGWNKTEFAGKFGETSQVLTNWIARGMPPGKHRQVAEALGWTIDKLITGADTIGNTSAGPDIRGKVPLISWVQAGDFANIVDNFQPGEADEWVDTTVPIHRHTYALRVSGPSMTRPTGIEPTFPDGCKIVVEPDLIDSPDNLVNLYVIARRSHDSEATFKQLVKDAGLYWLMPLNPQFEKIAVTDETVICGVVREKVLRLI